MLKKRSALLTVAGIAGILLVAAWFRPEPTEAQLGVEPVFAGGEGQAFASTPITIVASSLPIVGSATSGAPREVKKEHTILPEEQFEAAKAQAAAPGFGPALPVTLAGGPTRPSAATPGAIVNFDGDFQAEANCGSWIPADQALAAGDGTNPIIQAVNECLSVWTPGGARLLGPVSLQSFFGVGPSVSVCDPRALFDWRNHRFIVMAITCSAPYQAKVAVSQADNPLGAWWVYTFASNASAGALMDYPRLGQDHTVNYPGTTANPGAIYIAYNLFTAAGFNYVGEEWHILPKNRMYAGLGVSYWYFSGMSSAGGLTDSSQPANIWSPYERPRAEFFVTSRNDCVGACNQLTVWAVSNPMAFNAGGDAPRVTGTIINTANTFTIPPNAPQPGGPNTVDTLDNRFTGSVTYAHGFLHAAHSTGNGAGGTATELYKIQPFLNVGDAGCATSGQAACPQISGALIRNESVLNYGGTTAAFMAVAQPDLDGNVTMVFNYSNAVDTYPSIAYISQRVTQLPGQFVDNGFYLQTGLGRYTSGRWGDYMAVSPVGVLYEAGNGGATGNSAMLFSGMYSDTTAANRWRTRVGANIFNNVAQTTPVPLSKFGDRMGRSVKQP